MSSAVAVRCLGSVLTPPLKACLFSAYPLPKCLLCLSTAGPSFQSLVVLQKVFSCPKPDSPLSLLRHTSFYFSGSLNTLLPFAFFAEVASFNLFQFFVFFSSSVSGASPSPQRPDVYAKFLHILSDMTLQLQRPGAAMGNEASEARCSHALWAAARASLAQA
eukprot:5685142-Pleurochrysis_carterae.AAC.3